MKTKIVGKKLLALLLTLVMVLGMLPMTAFAADKNVNSISDFTCASITYGETPTPSGAIATNGTPEYSYCKTETGTFGTWESLTPQNVGTYYVKAYVAESDDYLAGEKVQSFEVIAKSISTAVVAKQERYSYTGNSVIPNLYYIRDGSTYLKEGEDYTLSYDRNTYVGQARVFITGTGNYTDTKTNYFYIDPIDQPLEVIKDLTFTTDQMFYSDELEPAISGNVGKLNFQITSGTEYLDHTGGLFFTKKAGVARVKATAEEADLGGNSDAEYNANTKGVYFNVYVVDKDPATPTISVMPETATVAKGATQDFDATVTGLEDYSVTWSVVSENPDTTIDENGLLTIAEDETAEELHVIAAVKDAPTSLSATAIVTVTEPASPGGDENPGGNEGSDTPIDVNYKVEHWLQLAHPIYDGIYVLDCREILTGTAGQAVTAEPKPYEGYTLDVDNEGARLSGTLTATDELTLKLYYNLNESTTDTVASATVVKAETSTPANGEFYVEGEKITYSITVTNTGDVSFDGGYDVYDILAPGTNWIDGGEHIDCEADCGEDETNVRVFTFEYTVTAADAAAGSVSNYAWLTYNVYENGELTDSGAARSNTVVSKTGVNLPGIPGEDDAPVPVEYTIAVTKVIAGDNAPNDAVFTFELSDGDNSTTVNITGEGKKSFAPLTFREAGTYRYTVEEQNSGLSGWTYDASVVDVVIEVLADDEDSEGNPILSIGEVVYTVDDDRVDGAIFTNTYTGGNTPGINPEETTIQLRWKKVVESNGTKDPGAQTFTIEIYDKNVDNIPTPTGLSITTTGNGIGAFYQTLTFTGGEDLADNLSEGFYLREVQETKDGWTYSDEAYFVCYNMDDGSWSIYEAEAAPGMNSMRFNEVSFTNSYDKDQSTGVQDPERYSVTVIHGKATTAARTVITEAEAGATITIQADAAPAGKVFDKWIIKSDTKPTLAKTTDATTTFTMPKGDVIVEATYKDAPVTPGTDTKPADPNVPKTGDSTHIFLWTALMLAAGIGVVVTTVVKKRKNTTDN